MSTIPPFGLVNVVGYSPTVVVVSNSHYPPSHSAGAVLVYQHSHIHCSPYWIRTNIFALEERRPVPLDEGAIFLSVGWDLNPRRDYVT